MIRPKCCTVPVRSRIDAEVMFELVFYGLDVADLSWIDVRRGRSGAEPIHTALRKRGIDPSNVVVSLFELRNGA